jgi:magnesium chelatase family protein
MKIISFMRGDIDLVPVEVEVSLMPGLPQISFLGLPDTMIRESVGRIKSALKHQGFEFPQARQVLVQLRPSHLRKSSHGLDLAVAAGILWEMGQIKPPEDAETVQVYGELTLKGEVLCPEDSADVPSIPGAGAVLTGEHSKLPYESMQIRNLKDLNTPNFVRAAELEIEWRRPELSDLSFCNEAGELLAVAAAGEHHALFCGPPGTGKTTSAEAIHQILTPVDREMIRTAERLARLQGDKLTWRPLIQPHHSATSLAMVGGGVPPLPGEITRAHGGVLLLDEFTEFEPVVQEALREPLEKGEIRIARSTRRRSFPAKFLLLATSNLCRCGKFDPGKDNGGCNCFNRDRRMYMARLRGPFVDRFAMLAITSSWSKERSVSLRELRDRVDRATEFRLRRGQGKLNSQLTAEEILPAIKRFKREHLLPQADLSRRRVLSYLRVARTLADLEQSKCIENRHLSSANRLCVEPFQALIRAGGQ